MNVVGLEFQAGVYVIGHAEEQLVVVIEGSFIDLIAVHRVSHDGQPCANMITGEGVESVFFNNVGTVFLGSDVAIFGTEVEALRVVIQCTEDVTGHVEVLMLYCADGSIVLAPVERSLNIELVDRPNGHGGYDGTIRLEKNTSEIQSRQNLVRRLLIG